MKTSVKSPAKPKLKKAGVHCAFKPEASKRSIQFATPKEAKAAGKWAIEKYHETFKALAK
jgi:hypothetical protein